MRNHEITRERVYGIYESNKVGAKEDLKKLKKKGACHEGIHIEA